jgi:hypothetical protein
MMSTRFKPAVVFDLSHLRALDIEMALSGHPIADEFGYEVRCFREMHARTVAYDVWDQARKMWLSRTDDRDVVENNLRLAPLVVVAAIPLFVGDTVEVAWDGEWESEVVSFEAHAAGEYFKPWVWRLPPPPVLN